MMDIKRKLKLTAASMLICTLAACSSGGSSGGGGNPDDDGNTEPQSSRDNLAFSLDADFQENYTQDFQDYLDEKLGPAVASINSMYNVFNDSTIPVVYKECGEPNAYYHPYYRSITLCHELANDAYRLFLKDTPDDKLEARRKAYSSVIFALYHEMGHALQDIRGLSGGGNFESVADGIGVVLSVKTSQPAAPFYAGKYFKQNGGASYADEHGSGEDRAGDMTCWVIGSSSRVAAQLPNTNAEFIAAGRDCVAEYADQYQYVSGLIPNVNMITPIGALQARSKVSDDFEFSPEEAAALDKIGVSLARHI